MAERLSYVVIGSGIAGATAAEILRSEDTAADITIIADDPFPVYYRPALKDYLGGKVREDKLWARPINFYQKRHIRFVADRVVDVQAAAHTVQLQSGRQMDYSRLLLAHGARASSLQCPGLHFEGVVTLRTVADYQKVLNRLSSVRRAVVVGSGTLALETIETLRHRGYQVTHLIRHRTLWAEVLDPIASDLVLQQERRDGVDIRLEQEIAEIVGTNGQVSAVITTAGGRISCELVVVAVGIEPLLDFVKRSGITCGRGIKVDTAMQTSVPDVYAAGDVVETTDPTTGRTRVIGQWYPAIQQARAAAYSMLDLLDSRLPFRGNMFYNATFLYGLDFAAVGYTNAPKGNSNYQEVIADPQPRMHQKVLLKDGVPVGVLALGERSRVLSYKRAIDHQVNLSPVASRLFSPDFKLGEWLDSQGVPGPILGASREGAAAVKQVAYAKAGDRSAILKSHPLIETVLVPLSPSEVATSVRETRLSQTKVVTVGRQEGATLSINHSTVSRRHAEISYANGQYVLRDLGSKNGTAVNTLQLAPNSVQVLQSGDKISFGKVTFAFQVRQLRKQDSMQSVRSDVGLVTKGSDSEQAPGDDGTVFVPMEPSLSRIQSVQATEQAPDSAQLSFDQPVFHADGSLALPGATSVLSSAVEETLKADPVLAVVIQGKPAVFPLKPGKRFIIGREAGNGIVLTEMSVSRKHAEVFPDSSGFSIRDLGSNNGVRINSTRITNPYHLSQGDRIALGNVMLYFLDQRQEAQRSSSPAQLESVADKQPRQPVSSQNGSESGGEEQVKNCLNCGASSPQTARFCRTCGASF